VDPACQGAISSPHYQTLVQTRNAFLNLGSPSSLVGTFVKVRGVGFYDDAHGQNGRSDSCLELHPLASIQAVNGTPPTITTQPQSQTVASGQSAILNVVATGPTALAYQWFTRDRNSTSTP